MYDMNNTAKFLLIGKKRSVRLEYTGAERQNRVVELFY
jgi:hypothetical protein